MLKKNLFHKKLSKIVLSITKRIESFFNLFKGLHSVKKIYLNSKKAILDKKIFFVLGTALILVIVYFLLPSFYDADKVKAQVENQILQEYNLKVKLNKKLQYGLFPKPHFLSVDAIIEHDSRIISNSKNTKFFISNKNLFNFNKIKVKNLVFTDTVFNIDKLNYKFFFDLLNNKTINKKIIFTKNKLFYLDQYRDIIFFTDVKKLNYFYQENLLNVIKSKLKIFNLPVSLNVEHNKQKKINLIEIDLNSLRLRIKNHLNYNDTELNGQIDLNLINKDQSIEYILKNNNITFKTSDNKLTGKINIKPFFLSSSLDLYEIEIKKFFEDNSILVNLLKSNLLNNKNLNGKINIFANNVKDLKFINEIQFDILFQEGSIIITNLEFIFKNSVIFKISDVNLIAENNRLKFIGDIEMNFMDIENFYSNFQIKKSHRRDIDKITTFFTLNLEDGFIELDNLRIKGVDNKILEKYLNEFNSKKKDITNKIVFRNTIKEFFKNISLD